jgi:hypothetical protein
LLHLALIVLETRKADCGAEFSENLGYGSATRRI